MEISNLLLRFWGNKDDSLPPLPTPLKQNLKPSPIIRRCPGLIKDQTVSFVGDVDKPHIIYAASFFVTSRCRCCSGETRGAGSQLGSARLGSARFSRTSRCTRTLHATRRRVSTPPSSVFERVSLCQNAVRRWRVVISAQPAAVLLSPFVKHVSPGCTSERSKKVFAAGGLARTLFALILNMLNKCIRLFCAHHRVVTFVVCLG